MRRSIVAARAASRALGSTQSRRAFASSAPSPIDPSKEQAHPIGPFYEAVLRTPSGAYPKVKPEGPPVTSKESPKAKPVEKPAAKPKSAPDAAEKSKPEPDAPAKPAPSKPAQENPVPAPAPPKKDPPKPEEKPKTSSDNSSAKSTKAAAPAEETSEKPAPKKRGPKAKTTTTSKSVPSSSTSSSYSSSSFLASSSSSLSSSTPEDLTSSTPSGPEIQISSSSKTASNSSEASQASSDSNSTRARVVFGSSLAGPAERAERLARIRNESTWVAGVLVPPKPEEPDNCCMSGCVNCVWDRFRDEMEDWSAKTQEAERRLAAREVGESVGATQESIDASSAEAAQRIDMSMDDDGGDSAANWDVAGNKKITKDLWDDELYKNVPVGIREFMKQEKRLKEKHAREGTLGG